MYACFHHRIQKKKVVALFYLKIGLFFSRFLNFIAQFRHFFVHNLWKKHQTCDEKVRIVRFIPWLKQSSKIVRGKLRIQI